MHHPRGATRVAPGFRAGLAMLALVLGGCAAGSPSPDDSPVRASPPSSIPTAAPASPAPTVASTPANPTPSTTAPSPASGRIEGRFDIGGRSLYIECGGSGSPALVFDAGLSGDSGSWGRYGFVPLLEPISRWCIYDRANRGRSDAAPGPRTSSDVVADLHALLVAADIEPPYVLVGGSFGGYNVRLYASTYPDEVAGLVLSDTVTPEFIAALEQELTPEQWAAEERGYRGGVEPKLDFLESGREVAAAPPLRQDIALVVVAASRDHLSNLPWPADWPGDRLEAIWQQEQVNLAALVPGGRLIIAEDTPHRIHVARPEFLAGIVQDIVDEVRGR